MTNEEIERAQQERLERRLDKSSGCALDGCLGCIPVLALLLLPSPFLLSVLT